MNHFINHIAGPKLRAVVQQDLRYLVHRNLDALANELINEFADTMIWGTNKETAVVHVVSPFNEALLKAHMESLQNVVSAMDARMWNHLGISAERLGKVREYLLTPDQCIPQIKVD